SAIICFAGIASASVVLSFEPLDQTLQRYSIRNIPATSPTPGAAALGVLSMVQLKQFDSRYEKTIHRILKIYTEAGKEFANVKIRCVDNCRGAARTIHQNGEIVTLAPKDIYISQKSSRYSAPYSYAQFS